MENQIFECNKCNNIIKPNEVYYAIVLSREVYDEEIFTIDSAAFV